MDSTLKGRIIEMGTEPHSKTDPSWIELTVGNASHFLQLDPALQTPPLAKGLWIEVQLNDQHRITHLTSLGGPAPGKWNPLSDALRWRRPVGKKSRMSKLQQRQDMLAAIRSHFYGENFLEIETPLLVKGTCPDAHIESIQAGEGYLVTSTEYQIKRLLVGGFEKVFTLTKNFRAHDRGRYHASEFTMLEWARSFATLPDIEKDAVQFIRQAFQTIHPHQNTLEVQGSTIDFLEYPWERITVREAFEKYLGLRNLADFARESLVESAHQAKIELPPHFKGDAHLVLSYLLDLLQPHLGTKTPTFLREWPAFMTSSGEVNLPDPHVGERSELYIAGIEIADGFPFLRNAETQKRFFQRELARRQANEQNPVALDSLYLEALSQGIPPGAGMALGIDRLALVLTQSESIEEVQAFSWNEI
jgi:lysyl-tRNA synthetase class 2